MGRSINIEGVIVDLPAAGFTNSTPPASNEYILGLVGLLAIFALSLPWGPVFSFASSLGVDTWTWVAIGLVILLRFVMLLLREPVGGTIRNGFMGGAAGKAAFFWDVLADMALTIALCALILLHNPLALGFILILLIGRFQSGRKTAKDFDYWYPYTAY